MKTKGIVLAGGAGSRLYPLTNLVCKQLLPVYDKPMIYYPLATLMLAGIREILIISTPEDVPSFEKILGDGSRLGLRLTYMPQAKPGGIAQAFLIGDSFIGQDRVVLILGDNIFYGDMQFLRQALEAEAGGTIFAYRVHEPERYGVVEFDASGRVLGLEEKPSKPKSSYAVTGLYLYGPEVVGIAKSLKPSPRGELEITDVNKVYLANKQLSVKVLNRGMAWLDTGTHRALLDASNFVETLESRQGLKFGCLEEIAFRRGYIKTDEMERLIKGLRDCQYRRYLSEILAEAKHGL